jgi:elongation factor G
MPSRDRIRNLGIAAHIDAGKTTLSERILFYTGKIHSIHEVHDHGDGPTLDYMDLEREKGITITAAAISCQWHDIQINLIDTPGHVDFTIEVERSLRVLDGAVLLLDAVAGVQAQSITVNRQMQRFGIPFITFINKLDRPGANPLKAVAAMAQKLNLNPVLLQYPMGLEGEFQGVIDLVEQVAHYYEGEYGEHRLTQPIPEAYASAAQAARDRLIDQLSLVSDAITEAVLSGQGVTPELLWSSLRTATLRRQLTPVLLGSALKNKGIQDLLDAVARYLPAPPERDPVIATEVTSGKSVAVPPDPKGPAVMLAFKLVEDEFGPMTYGRLYSGTLKPGDRLVNSRTQQPWRVNRLIQIEADKRRELEEAVAGDIVGLVGVDSPSGDTLCSPEISLTLEGISVPDPVMTIAITSKVLADCDRIELALQRFAHADPTLRVSLDPESKNTLLSGMGELHLQIYLERLRREYGAEVYVSEPAVAYRETITQAATFDYTFEQALEKSRIFAHIAGRLEPKPGACVVTSQIPKDAMPQRFVEACRQGVEDALQTGILQGYPMVGINVVLTNATRHPTESTEAAFRFAARRGFEQGFAEAQPQLLEPMMSVEVETPEDYLGAIQGKLLARQALLLGSETLDQTVIIRAEVPLASMFGYSTELRSISHGMATFTMEFSAYRPMVSQNETTTSQSLFRTDSRITHLSPG